MGYKPIITKISAFDATIGTTVYFGWKGAQAFANELIIKDSETLDVVYQYKTGRQMSLYHVLNLEEGTKSPNVTENFINGRLYQATLIVYDKDNVASDISDTVTFWCFSEPVFRIISENVLNGIVTMSSLYLNFYYQQNEGEILSEYYVALYDSDMQLLHKSKTFNGSNSEEYLEYRIEGLLNSHSYFIEVNGVTAHGMNITTGSIPFSIKYDKMGVGALVYLKDIGNGKISISSNFKILDTISNPDPVKFIDNESVDLRDDGSYVEFFDGFEVSGNYECKLKLRNIVGNQNFILKNEKGENIVLSYNYFDIDFETYTKRKYYFKLTINSPIASLSIPSKMFDEPTPEQFMTVLIQHVSGYYNIKVLIE